MAIVSVSLSDKLLEEIDELKDGLGFSGRSDVIRASARLLIADMKEKSSIKGDANSVLLLIHDQNSEDRVTEIKHDFEDIINTQIHSHIPDDKCLELFLMEGDVERMTQLSNMFQTIRQIEYVKLIII